MAVEVLVADDHPLILSGYIDFLNACSEVSKVYTATNGNDAYNLISNHEPSLAILDFDMPNLTGLEVARALKKLNLDIRIVIMTLHKQPALVQEVGVSIHGCITKDAPIEELRQCLNDVFIKNRFISKAFTELNVPESDSNEEQLLTHAERKIVRYLLKNLSSAEIAEELFISKRTVEKHRSNIIQKLGLDSKSNSLLLWAQQHPDLW